MICIEVCYQNGEVITTKFNGTFKEAMNYYVGKTFNIGTVSDDLQVCIGVRLLYSLDSNLFKQAGPQDVSVGTLCALINGDVRLVDNGGGNCLFTGNADAATRSCYASCLVETVTALNGIVSIWLPRK